MQLQAGGMGVRLCGSSPVSISSRCIMQPVKGHCALGSPPATAISNHSRAALRRCPLAVRGALQPTPRPGQPRSQQAQRGDLQVGRIEALIVRHCCRGGSGGPNSSNTSVGSG